MKDKLLVDIGNTRVHLFKDKKIFHISKERLFRQYGESDICYINVNHTLEAKLESKKNWKNLAQFLSIEGEYATMGVDRKAICLSYNNGIFVDAGSAITVDVVKEGRYIGGFILPGIKEYLKAYQSISSVLEVEIDKACDISKLPKQTSGAISYGIISSIISSIKKERIAHKLPLYLTGGDGAWLASFFKEVIYDEGLLFKGLQNAIKDKIC
jgi:type III pantothenate kinase